MKRMHTHTLQKMNIAIYELCSALNGPFGKYDKT